MDDATPLQKVELALLRSEHQKRYLARIATLKDRVGAGVEYHNRAARAIVSGSGAYCELLEIPEEFVGAAGAGLQIELATTEALLRHLSETVAVAQGMGAAGDGAISLFLLYEPAGVWDRRYCYSFRSGASGDQGMVTFGAYRPDTVPLFFKSRIALAAGSTGRPGTAGLTFGLAHVAEAHLIVRAPFAGGQIVDLNAPERSRVIS